MTPTTSARDRLAQAPPVAELGRDAQLQVATLSNGRYHVRLSEVGSGYSECEGVAISRALPDDTRDADGFHIFLRDLDDNFVWSVGYQPTRIPTSQYDFHCDGGTAVIRRVDRNIECRLTVCVAPHEDLEIRRCELTNLDDRPRRIELTSYLEWVLGSREADASHPVFSKLFVETLFSARQNAIFARRRPRHSDESEFWGFHSIISDVPAGDRHNVQFETNRARFIGRRRTLRRPLALDAGKELSGDCGPVLDPIASLRMPVALEPGQSRGTAFILGGARERSRADVILAALEGPAEIERIIGLASTAANSETNGAPAADGVPPSPGRRVIVHPPHRHFMSESIGDLAEPEFVPALMADAQAETVPTSQAERLQFDNGYGGFSADGHEYVVVLPPNGPSGPKRPPAPWVNVIANETAGFLVTDSGAGYMWSGNSRENRLTAWHNDPVVDPHSEALWIRDEDAGIFWSPTPGPTPAGAEYRVRHGFGYTVFEHESHGLSQQVTMFVARHEPVKLTRLRVLNRSGRPRRLSLFSYLHWNLAAKSFGAITTSHDTRQNVIWATNPNRECYGKCVAFSALRLADKPRDDISFTCDRAFFLGRHGDTDAPRAIVAGSQLDGRTGTGFDPCTAWHVEIDVPPGGTFECTYLLGEVASRDIGRDLINKFSQPPQIEQALTEVQQFWRDTLSAVEIQTPHREIDLMVNGWLLYQNMSCRLWGRSAYYQPGGAFGFRDQLQDAAALIYHRPDLTRAQLLRHAAQQFTEGDVLHWWHPDTGYGLRTRFADDLLWLPFIAAQYVETTGDASILDEQLPFLAAPPLAEDQQEAYLCPTPAESGGSLYEHCCRALDRGLTTGPHGLPLIGCGDWNDGFSRVGRLGRGESVWLGFFIDVILDRMLVLCAERGDAQRVVRYEDYRKRLRDVLNSAGWDGAWYRRAYYDNGHPIGSASSDECQIDALAQAWAVLSGIAPPDRAEAALRAAESRLVDDEAGIIRLLAPAFDRTPHDPGYIKGYLPGIRENGGQYTHGVLWVVRAMAELGRGSRAVELLRMLTPIWHTSSTERADLYQTEPYVVAADVYGEPPHVGRAGWTWYTGSAGWMFRVAVESILGLSIEGGHTLVMNPSISSTWPECRLNYRLPGCRTRYEITIANPDGQERGVTAASVDGRPIAVENGTARVPLQRDGWVHRVSVRL